MVPFFKKRYHLSYSTQVSEEGLSEDIPEEVVAQGYED